MQPDTARPDFADLPPVPGLSDVRWVGSTMMDRTQYLTEGWHIVARFTRDDGKPVTIWSATLDGLRTYGQRRPIRPVREGAEEDDASFDAWTDAIADAKPMAPRRLS